VGERGGSAATSHRGLRAVAPGKGALSCWVVAGPASPPFTPPLTSPEG
jgi:hypothetical protein